MTGQGRKWRRLAFLAFSLLAMGMGLYLILRWLVAIDKIVPTVEMIKEQEHLALFHVGVVKIIPTEFDFDTERLEYEYETTIGNASELFTILDARAVKDGWQIEEQSANGRTYSKLSQLNQHSSMKLVVNTTFLTESRQVKIVANHGPWIRVTD
jgi:hypothetical protein